LNQKKTKGRNFGLFCQQKNKILKIMKTILFIEDEPALQKTLGDTLRQGGYNVISALDGKSGLDLAKSKKPDLILLDLILPRLNGFDVLRSLKSDISTKNIPVIILTNLENIEDVDKAVELGAKAYLVKAQYSLQEVFKKIKDALEE
jgi:DNA-binding response OmpR family regulator